MMGNWAGLAADHLRELIGCQLEDLWGSLRQIAANLMLKYSILIKPAQLLDTMKWIMQNTTEL